MLSKSRTPHRSYAHSLPAVLPHTSDDPLDVVRLIKATGMKASVAINPGTPASEISDELGDAVDMILVMTVWPGEHLFVRRRGIHAVRVHRR